jgi:hypothetical protein
MPDDGGMNHPRDRPGRAGALMQCLGEIAPLYQIGKTLEEFADMNRRAMKVEESLRKNADRDDAADQNRPHEQTTLLDVIDHAGTS